MMRHGTVYPNAGSPINYFDGLYTLVDHCPPPGPVMLLIVEKAIETRRLRSPERWPWSFLGGFSTHSTQQWAHNGVYPTFTCATCAQEFRLWGLPITESAGRISGWLYGQCESCERIYWMADDDRVLDWINGERDFNPSHPLCRKPALDVKGRKRFAREWERAKTTRKAPDKPPTFTL